MSEEKNNIDILRDELIHDISEHEVIILEEWEKSSSDNRDFHQLIKEMKLSPEVEQRGEAMKPYILQQVNNRINKDGLRKRILKIAGIAASIAILLGITNYLSYEKGFREVNSQMIEMSNPLGMLSTLILPDGSKVILNGGTTITYPNAFVGRKREVGITGEAFFSVVHDSEQPFIVKADHIHIEVLGTEFNVKAYEEDERIEVSLLEGKVGVRMNNKNEQLFLMPGEQAYYDKLGSTLTNRQVNIAHYTSWKDGIYYFRTLPLKEITRQLERIFNVRIEIVSPQLQNVIITGDFLRGENLEQILRVITADRRLKYRIEEDAVYIEER